MNYFVLINLPSHITEEQVADLLGGPSPEQRIVLIDRKRRALCIDKDRRCCRDAFVATPMSMDQLEEAVKSINVDNLVGVQTRKVGVITVIDRRRRNTIRGFDGQDYHFDQEGLDSQDFDCHEPGMMAYFIGQENAEDDRNQRRAYNIVPIPPTEMRGEIVAIRGRYCSVKCTEVREIMLGTPQALGLELGKVVAFQIGYDASSDRLTARNVRLL